MCEFHISFLGESVKKQKALIEAEMRAQQQRLQEGKDMVMPKEKEVDGKSGPAPIDVLSLKPAEEKVADIDEL